MDTKKLLVSLSLAVLAIFMVATVSATGLVYDLGNNNSVGYSTGSLTDTAVIEIDGINVLDSPSVVAGDSIAVIVEFTANVGATDVTVEVELGDNKVVSKSFDVEANHTYKKTLKVEVPSDLKDEISDKIRLDVKIEGEDSDGDDVETEFNNIAVNVQRPSYNPVVKSVTVSQSVEAGETFPVEFVLKNLGYNELEDVYVTVGISELGVYKTAYLGDIIELEDLCKSDDDDCDDTVKGTLYLEVPYGVEAGVYTLEVVTENDDVVSKATKQIVIENDFAENVIATTTGKTVKVGEEAEYTLLLVNPTNKLKVYTITSESDSKVSSETESVVAVPAGSSKTVTVNAKASEAGEYKFNVNVLSGSVVESTVALSLTAEEKTTTSPVVILTVILAIVFLVLLVVLIVLLGKKSNKTEEFGESYY